MKLLTLSICAVLVLDACCRVDASHRPKRFLSSVVDFIATGGRCRGCSRRCLDDPIVIDGYCCGCARDSELLSVHSGQEGEESVPMSYNNPLPLRKAEDFSVDWILCCADWSDGYPHDRNFWEPGRERWPSKKFMTYSRRNHWKAGRNVSNQHDNAPYRSRRPNLEDNNQQVYRPRSRNRPVAIPHSQYQKPEVQQNAASDEQVESEKRNTACILKNRLMSLSDEYKSNSMKQLIEDPTQNEGSSSVKPSKSVKQARRIAHVPKPVQPSQQEKSPSKTFPLIDISADLSPPVRVRKTSNEQIMQHLMQDLMMKSPEDLKRLATSPKSSENAIFQRLTAMHRAQMSEAMRKLSEHKLQLEEKSSPQLLAELEQLVEPDMAIDMYNMPLETLQCLQDIFNLHRMDDMQCQAEVLPISRTETDKETQPKLNGNSCQKNESSQLSPPSNGVDRSLLKSLPSENNLLNEHPVSKKAKKKKPKKQAMMSQQVNVYTPPQCILDQQTQTDDMQRVPSRMDHDQFESNGRNESEQLFSDFQNFLYVMDSSVLDDSSRILKSTAVNCISALIQNFTKQFTELHSKQTADVETFLDPNGTIKRIKIPAICNSVFKMINSGKS